jgi:hypothetical protein
MTIRTHLIATSLVGILLAIGCTITSDNKGSVFHDFDSGTGATSNGGNSRTGGMTHHGGQNSGTPDASVTMMPDAGGGPVDVDSGSDSGSSNMCFAPNGDTCSDCVANNCLAEYCACEGDGGVCGTAGGELQCMIDCVYAESQMGTPAADAFSGCADICPTPGEIMLSTLTDEVISCMRMAVPDPLFADAGITDGGVPEIAQCGESCFGYFDPATQ